MRKLFRTESVPFALAGKWRSVRNPYFYAPLSLAFPSPFSVPVLLLLFPCQLAVSLKGWAVTPEKASTTDIHRCESKTLLHVAVNPVSELAEIQWWATKTEHIRSYQRRVFSFAVSPHTFPQGRYQRSSTERAQQGSMDHTGISTKKEKRDGF